VLDADVVVRAGGIEEPSGALRVEVVEADDADTAVAQDVVVGAVVEAVPDVVVPRPGWYAMLSGILNSDDPCTNSCTCGTVLNVVAPATLPSVMQTVSPQ